MSQTVRFGVSMDAELLAALDGLLARKGYANRSEAIRDLVRDAIVEDDWDADDEPTAAVLSLVYDHHVGELAKRLTRIQHDQAGEITATLHVHLDHRHCLEVLVLRGLPRVLKKLSDKLVSTRGVKHGKLLVTTAGSRLP